MTKYKKLTRSSFVIVALCLALVGILAFGGTYAYFSASDKATGNVTLGKLEVSLKDGDSDYAAVVFETTIAQPNQKILNKELTIAKGETNINYYARVKLTATVTPAGGAAHKAECGDSTLDASTVLTPAIDGWVLVEGYYYQGATADATATVNSTDVQFTPTIVLNALIGKGECTYYMGATVAVTVSVEVLQADYLTSTDTAASNYKVSELAANWATKA